MCCILWPWKSFCDKEALRVTSASLSHRILAFFTWTQLLWGEIKWLANAAQFLLLDLHNQAYLVDLEGEKNLWRWINPPLSLPVNQFYCLGVLLSQIGLLIMETAVYKASLSSDVIVASTPKSDPKEKSVMNELLKLLLIFFFFGSGCCYGVSNQHSAHRWEGVEFSENKKENFP